MSDDADPDRDAWRFPVSAVQRRLPGARRVVVLDDDPTGTQTVRGVPVLTAWDEADLAWALEQGGPGFFVLTNTRSMAPRDAERVNREVVQRALAAAGDVPLVFASRGDSTLRGHFPLETDAIQAAEGAADAVLLTPAYIDAGRITRDGVHWIADGDALTPVAESEFARDATFGYRSSRLADWVAEVSGGTIPADRVTSVSLADVRAGEPLDRVVRGTTGVIAPDAVTDDDLRAIAAAVLDAEADGRRFVYRTGPSFVRARLGQGAAPQIDDARLRELVRPGNGLVVVGSHVARTTEQLERLTADGARSVVELDVERIVAGPDPVPDAVDATISALGRGTAVLTTSRRLRRGDDAAASLSIARSVSAALTETVARVARSAPPAFVVAKGGITSSDVATVALGIRRATVEGSLLPGIVSLWRADEGPSAGLPYVVFAGNVGDADALRTVVRRLEEAT